MKRIIILFCLLIASAASADPIHSKAFFAFTQQPAVPAPFSPTSITGLQLWVKASTITVANGANVTNWPDSSGKGRNLAYDGTAPVNEWNALNNTNVVKAAATTWALRYSTGYTNYGELQTVFVVVKHRTGSQNYAHLLCQGTANFWHGGLGTALFQSPFTPAAILNGSMWVDGTSVTPSTVQKSTSWKIYSFEPLTGPYQVESITSITQGGRSWDGSFAELLCYEGSLGATDRQKVEGYLAWRWGLQGNLPVDHPYKSAAP